MTKFIYGMVSWGLIALSTIFMISAIALSYAFFGWIGLTVIVLFSVSAIVLLLAILYTAE